MRPNRRISLRAVKRFGADYSDFESSNLKGLEVLRVVALGKSQLLPLEKPGKIYQRRQ